MGVFGELLLTGSAVVALYAGYELVWTNIRADQAASAEVAALRERWRLPAAAPDTPSRQARGRDQPDRPDRPDQPADPSPVVAGEAFALLYIPRLGESFVQPVIEGAGDGPGGISEADLAHGVVHYPGTGLPGRVGNFAVAGHRATNGEPFADLDQLRPGDAVIVQISDAVHTYTVTSRRIVSPDATQVLAPTADVPAGQSTRRLLTLTTCHPRWSSNARLVVRAEHANSIQRSSGPPQAVTTNRAATDGGR